jgi:hypothetical protein
MRLGAIALLGSLALVGIMGVAAWPWLVRTAPSVTIAGAVVTVSAALAWLVRFVFVQWQNARMAAAQADAVNLESDVRRARAARDITLAEIEAQRAAWELQRDQMATALAAQARPCSPAS